MKRFTETDKIIGANIKRIRQKKGVLQEDLFNLLGCTKTHMSYIENGKSSLRAGQLYEIASYMRVNVNQFFKK